MLLSSEFFQRDTLKVAQELLGKVLAVENGGKILKGIIVETESYIGEDDLACHASKGRTKRTETMYQKAGTVYVYLVYGMHHCLNIVTEKEDYPAAVLIRAVIPVSTSNVDSKDVAISGPGRVCRYFGIDKSFNGSDISSDKIWIEDAGIKIAPKNIEKSKRIGVDYAKHCKNYLWRFSLPPEIIKNPPCLKRQGG
ncbi:MAG: DNA-3-methyladenine glycosylase [Candidatus Pacebacteria bacterium]|nr:DNA-3-methyladenine glycosylase [Candidatus Paceibacterota bacterium]NUQ57295.1 DNA-3-methyladenine glycosylase [Candidatus Paceibacter sp.]